MNIYANVIMLNICEIYDWKCVSNGHMCVTSFAIIHLISLIFPEKPELTLPELTDLDT